MKRATVNIGDAAKYVGVTLTVRGLRWFNFRKALGLGLVRLGLWVIGVTTRVESEP